MVNVQLTGRAAIDTERERLEPPPGKTTALLYYVAYQEGWVSRNDLIFLFYPDIDEHSARQNLRPLLTRLRHLEYAEGLEIEPTRLRWNVHTDVQVFREALREHRPAQAVQQYQGTLLEGFHLAAAPEFESWLEFERNDLQSSWRSATLEFVAELESGERHGHAAEVLERLHKADPFDEEVFNHYLTALARGERHQDALKAFEAFEAMLKREVETEPGDATLRLIEQIRQGHVPNLASEKPEGTTKSEASKLQLKMPPPTTAFIGREADIAELVEQLGDPACRLLTLVASGGMGKTRLATKVSEKLAPEFKDGVVFVPFEAVSSPALMVSAVANALGFSFFGSQQPKDQLLSYLEPKNMLLILDNLEHLLDGTSLITEMLQTAPALKILATSRERLGLHAEWLYDLMGMTLPGANSSDLQASDAVSLFAQAARKARADFTLNDNFRTVAHICYSLGGMPLSIELAASWLRVLSVAEIAGELGKGMDLLESSLRDLPVRHHDIRTVFDTSWQRLSANEQTALRKLAVFQGGFTQEAAREVADLGLPLLLAFSNKSFLHREASGRFAQHPLMWQYLREKASGDAATFAQTRERHAEYFAAFMQEREDLLQGLEAEAVRATLEQDLPNLREGWFWAADQERQDLLNKAAKGLVELYIHTRRYQEGEAMFSYAAKKLQSQSIIQGRMLRNLGHIYHVQLDYKRGVEVLQASIIIFRQHGVKHDEALALNLLSRTYDLSSRPEHEVKTLMEMTVALCREVGDKYEEARVLSNLAGYYHEPKQRERYLREAIRLFREVEGYFGITLALCNLAQCQAEAYGAYQGAEALLEEAIAIERKRGMPSRLARWLNQQGGTSIYRGHLAAAEEHFVEAQNIGETLEPGFGMWELESAVYGLGQLAHLRGDYAEAKRLFTRALELNSRHADPTDAKLAILLSFSKLALIEGNIGEAFTYCQQTQFGTQHFYGIHAYALENVVYLNQLGRIALAQENLDDAAEQFRQALATAREWGFLPAALDLCVSFASLFQLQGEEKHAVRLLDIAANHPASMFETKEAAKRRLDGLPGVVNKGPDRTSPLTLEEVAGEMLSS